MKISRIRTIKPEFFRHEALQDLESAHPGAYPMLVFIGLWGHCDRAGRFEWKPRHLKLDILPFLSFDLEQTLSILVDAGLVTRYGVDGKEYGLIPSFVRHQRIGGKEAQEPPHFPDPPENEQGKQRGSNGEAFETAGREGKGREKEGKGKHRGGGPPVDNFGEPVDNLGPKFLDKNLQSTPTAKVEGRSLVQALQTALAGKPA